MIFAHISSTTTESTITLEHYQINYDSLIQIMENMHTERLVSTKISTLGWDVALPRRTMETAETDPSRRASVFFYLVFCFLILPV